MQTSRCCITRLGSLRSVRNFAEGSVRLASAGSQVLGARDEESVVETGASKVSSLTARAGDLKQPDNETVLASLAQNIKSGFLNIKDLFEGVRNGSITQSQLTVLMNQQAISSFALQQIRTNLHQGTSSLSFTEVAALLKRQMIGFHDLVRVMREGDLVPADIELLVSKELLPRDVADAVIAKIRPDQTNDHQVENPGFAEILSRLKKSELSQSILPTHVVSGNLHPDDIPLLIAEEALTPEEGERLLEICADDVLSVYEETEKFAELVGKSRFTFEELEVMRAKGVLGSSLVHYLVARDVITDSEGASLLEIEEDHDYIDPDDTDNEPEEISALNGDETFKVGSVDSIPRKPGVPDYGFYPKDTDRSDTFGLWQHLMDVYADRPGRERHLDMLQESSVEDEAGSKLRDDEEAGEKLPDVETKKDGSLFAIGKRKESVAKVSLKKGEGNIVVNGKCFRDYFPKTDARNYILAPLLLSDAGQNLDAEIEVEGGGWSGQAQAIRHGIAKVMCHVDEDLYSRLTDLGLVKADGRRVERKKPGRAKARKSFQWVKR